MTAFPDHASEALTDTEVIDRILGGDTALFELLMRRYNQRVYRSVRGIVRDEAEAEDVMQQAYVNAFGALRQFAGRSAFSTWLTRIAINEAFARIRPRPVPTDTLMNDIESNAPDPEQQAASAEIGRVMEAEITALPETYRCVLMLREIEGLSTAETAECLGVAEDVVKTRLHRARGMLRDGLYRRAGLTFESLFPFGSARCDRVVARVMARITSA
ncbi:MAG TPA: RNA polymerase sigma factor [Thermoanaerobaculia bacterium]|jgi:RNA polymerase sigma-70 factor (ECF subfamily)|nr:RNA polymerase sigma factor [Thermoanaerobaculia bacterium]